MSFIDPSGTRLGPLELLFVLVAAILLPLVAIKSAHKAKAAVDKPRSVVLGRRTVVLLLVIAAAAVVVARRANIALFAAFPVTTAVVAASIVVLAGVLLLQEALLRAASPADRRELWNRQVIPPGNAERVVWLVSVTLAAIAEEVIYRGVLFALLAVLTESLVAAAVVSAISFALAHYRQGWKSMAFIAGIALLFQSLVVYTGSVVPAMIVHTIYNIARGMRATAALNALHRH